MALVSTPLRLLAVFLLVAVVLAGTAWWRGRGRRRQRAVSGLLDAADALETRLRTARAELEAVIDQQSDPVREAMQQILRHRLWLQQHGAQASLAEIERVRKSLDDARAAIEAQLQRVERARSSAPPLQP